MEEIDPQRYVLPGLLALLVVGAFLILVTSGGGSDDPVRPPAPAATATTAASTPDDELASSTPVTTTDDLPAEIPEEPTETTSTSPAATVSPALPDSDPLAAGTATTDAQTQTPPSEPTYIKVQQGDTMASIAAATGVSKSRLIALNPGVDPADLPPGKLLKTGP